ncbi:MAG: DUF1559 domain-containing protein [Planctomycetales bacterium]|nr:DUF1559 domain-containing protein [Planctomycetales bacterium]
MFPLLPTRRVPVTLVCLWGVLLLLGAAGCGGLSSDDMRSRMIKRPPDPEEEQPAAPRLAAAKPAEPTQTTPAAQDPTQPASPQPPASTGASVAQTAADAGDKPAATAAASPQPAEPLPKTPEARARRSAENLEKIAAALEQYREVKGRYPLYAIADSTRAPLLSWRVELLPFLGYKDLYLKFDQQQPWYAPKNKALLSEIPPVYMSSERGDLKTNYLAPMGSATIFQKLRTLHPRRIEDGLINTVLLVEVDDPLAQEWTKPEEYPFNPGKPKEGLGTLRGGQVFLAWGGGTVGSVSLKSSDEEFKAIFTADGGEPYTMASLNHPIDFAAAAGPGASVAAADDSPSGSAPATGGALSTRQSPAGAPRSALAEKFLRASAAALSENTPTDAWRWFCASLAISGPSGELEWYPALRRPAPALHFGVGVAANAKQNQGNHKARTRALTKSELENATAPFGKTLIDAIEKHAVKASLTSYVQPVSESRGRRGGGRSFSREAAMTVLPEGDEADIRNEAMRVGCDVLALFEVDENQRSKHRVVRLRLYDLVGRKELLTSRRLTYNPLETRRGDQDDNEDLSEAKWRLDDLLEDGLSPAPWPVTLNANIAKRRVASLAGSRDPFPPRVIAEMLFYRNRGLIDNAEVLSALEELLGNGAGIDLLLGSDSKRRRVLREWLPNSSAEDLRARVEGRKNTQGNNGN